MQQVARLRILLFVLSLVLVPSVTYLVILFARGYRPDFKTKKIQPTGILAIRSLPNSAQIFISGILREATDATFNLSPGEYQVEVKKVGFHPWKKNLTVTAEIVTSANAWLFPTVPSLKAVTSTGAANPVASPQGNSIVFSGTGTNQNRLYSLDLSESPLGLLNREARLVVSAPTLNFATSTLNWSPDSRQILVTASSSAYLIDLSNQQISDVSLSLPQLLTGWATLRNLQEQQKFATLPLIAQNILATSAADLVWSPGENKLLYTATASAVLPENIIRPLPGSSTQKQERVLVPGRVYVYDLEEDRNFYLTTLPAPTPTPKPKSKITPPVAKPLLKSGNAGLTWFPSSGHLVKVEHGNVTIVEYDGSNQTNLYSGPMEGTLAIPYPSGKQLLILTNLTPTLTGSPNLYAVSLR